MKKTEPKLSKELAVIEQGLSVIALPDIETDQDYERIREQYKDIQAMGKKLEEKKKLIIDPINQGIKEIKALFLPAETRFLAISNAFSQKLTSYINRREIARKNALKSLEQNTRIKNVELLQNRRDEIGDRLPGAMKLKRLAIDDFTIIPREYMVPDEKKILTAILAGKKVKGCRVVEELVVTAR